MPDLSSSTSLYGQMFTYVDEQLVSTNTVLRETRSVTRIGVNTPHFAVFKKLKTVTGLPMNPFSYAQVVRKRGQGELSVRNTITGQVSRYSGVLADNFGGTSGGDPWEPSAPLLANMRNRVILKILGKLKDQSVNLAQVFAERKQTADLIASTAIRLADSFSKIKRGDLAGAAGAIGVGVSRNKVTRFNRTYSVSRQDAIASGWLQLQYGWQPLLMDVHGSAEWLAKKQSREIRGKVSTRLTERGSTMNRFVNNTSPVYDVDTLTDGFVDYSAVVYFATVGTELASLKEAGITNPAFLAWELLPYSFVVDWFLPVGNYLSSFDSTLGLGFHKGAFTRFWDGSSSQHCSAFGKVDNVINRVNAGIKSSATKLVCQREVMPTFPSADLPSFKSPVSFVHAANAIALLSNVFNKR